MKNKKSDINYNSFGALTRVGARKLSKEELFVEYIKLTKKYTEKVQQCLDADDDYHDLDQAYVNLFEEDNKLYRSYEHLNTLYKVKINEIEDLKDEIEDLKDKLELGKIKKAIESLNKLTATIAETSGENDPETNLVEAKEDDDPETNLVESKEDDDPETNLDLAETKEDDDSDGVISEDPTVNENPIVDDDLTIDEDPAVDEDSTEASFEDFF